MPNVTDPGISAQITSVQKKVCFLVPMHDKQLYTIPYEFLNNISPESFI